MGANEPQSTAARRREIAERRGEPIQTEYRSVLDNGGACYVNIPEFAATLLGIDVGDRVKVDEYDDRIELRPIPEGDDA
jgi:hypothetical protein